METNKGSVLYLSSYYPGFVCLSPKKEEWQEILKSIKEDLKDPDLPDEVREHIEEIITYCSDAVEVSLEELRAMDALVTKNGSGATA